jgi:hypothetical protein
MAKNTTKIIFLGGGFLFFLEIIILISYQKILFKYHIGWFYESGNTSILP